MNRRTFFSGLLVDCRSKTNPKANLDVEHLGAWIEVVRSRRPDTPSPLPEAHASALLTHLANNGLRTGETIAAGKLASGSPGAELWACEYLYRCEMRIAVSVATREKFNTKVAFLV